MRIALGQAGNRTKTSSKNPMAITASSWPGSSSSGRQQLLASPHDRDAPSLARHLELADRFIAVDFRPGERDRLLP